MSSCIIFLAKSYFDTEKVVDFASKNNLDTWKLEVYFSARNTLMHNGSQYIAS